MSTATRQMGSDKRFRLPLSKGNRNSRPVASSSRKVKKNAPVKNTRLKGSKFGNSPAGLPLNAKRQKGTSLFRKLMSAFSGAALLVMALGLLLAISIVLLAGYRWLNSSDFFALSTVQVNGVDRLGKGEVLEMAEVATGMNSLAVNMRSTQRKLEEMPWISSATLKRELPDRLSISIEERVPAFWVKKGNELQYADADGLLIDTVGPKKMISLPVLLVSPVATLQPEMLKQLTQILKTQAPFGYDRIDWIAIHPGQGLEIAVEEPRVLVRTGLDGWKKELQRAFVVWNDLSARGELGATMVIEAHNDKAWAQYAY